MRISDWSSDVCSSDLDALQHRPRHGRAAAVGDHLVVDLLELVAVDLLADQEGRLAAVVDLDLLQHLADDHLDVLVVDLHALQAIDALDLVDQVVGQGLDAEHVEDVRSEEHTSELKSLMRISYAVFCLKKKTLT